MKLALDENLPPSLAHAVHALLHPEDGLAVSIPERFGRGFKDTDWMTVLGEEDGWAVVTADRKIRTRPLEKKALLDAGLIVFVLAPGWNQEPYWPKVTGIIRWIPSMITAVAAYKPPALLSIPHKFTPATIKPFAK